jgi:LysM repeat protein
MHILIIQTLLLNLNPKNMNSSYFQYTILSGDTLSKVANKINACFGITEQLIVQANPTINPATLEVGSTIHIPATTEGIKGLDYTVRPGDSFTKIANGINTSKGVNYEKIEQANPTVNPNDIQIGELINIPPNDVPQENTPQKNTRQEPTQTNAVPLPVENIGYWHWTYHSSVAPPETTMGMAFFGATDPAIAIENSAKVKPLLKGDKYICLGGGTDAGRYTSEVITKIIAAIKSGDFAGYQGIAFDVEVGDSGLSEDFKSLFAITKANQFKVLVTVSHSRPYGIHDGTELTRTFLADENIDFISPQLYTTGKESANQYADFGIHWSAYASSKSAVVPSIVKPAYYEDAVVYFKKVGVELKGYIQWSQY